MINNNDNNNNNNNNNINNNNTGRIMTIIIMKIRPGNTGLMSSGA